MTKKLRNNEHLETFVTVNGTKYAYHPDTGLEGAAVIELSAYIFREASRFLHSLPYSSIEIEDLISDCRISALHAARRYNPARNVAFITYASFWIRRALQESYGKTLIRTPRGKQTLGITRTNLDAIEAYDQTNFSEDLERRDLLKKVFLEIKKLPTAKASLLLEYSQGKTLSEIAKERGYTRQRASQILCAYSKQIRSSIAA